MEVGNRRLGWSCDLLIAIGNKVHEDIYRHYEFIGSIYAVAADMEEKKHDAKNINIFAVEVVEATKEDLDLLEKAADKLGDL